MTRVGTRWQGEAWRWLQGDVGWLIASQGLRNLATALLSVVVPLSLAADGYSTAEVGLALSLGSLLTTAVMVAVGFFSDRVGRRRTLLALGAASTLGILLMAVSSRLWVLSLAIGLSAVGAGGGAGSSGSSGPTFPPTQALLADRLPPERRNAAFVAVFLVSVLAGAVGAAFATLPHNLHDGGMSWSAAYRLLFWACGIFSLTYLAAVWVVKEGTPRRSSAGPTRAALGLIGKLWMTNSLTGLAWGVTGTFLTYWFHLRFGVGPLAIGSLYTISNVAVALAAVAAVPLARRWGVVRTVVFTRFAVVALLGAMIWAPSFWISGVIFIVRLAIGSISVPLRQSFVMGVSEERNRTAVAAFGNLPSQFTSSFAPSLSSELVQNISIDAPLAVAALAQLANAAVYFWAFHNLKPPEERAASHRGPSSAGVSPQRGG
jgi:MFS family permease